MTTVNYIAAFCIVQTAAFGQLSDNDEKKLIRIRKPIISDVAVELVKMNVLYVGLENPLQVYSKNNSSDLRLVISDGEIWGGNGSYTAKVSKPGISELSIFNGKKLLGTKKYRVKRVPDPMATIAGSRGGNIDRVKLVTAFGIVPELDNFDFELFYKVVSFRMTLYRKGKDPLGIECNGNKITANMRLALAMTRSGDKVYFEFIKAVGPDGCVRRLNSINFNIQ